ncbi:MAG: cysteine--tRNA ligase [Lentisphaeria bacterium]|jgi:cysteinyl-tRNA synthetase
MPLRFHNSLSRRLEEFTPLVPGEARLYTCGPTVYNYAHIGNFRAYIFEDLLRRTLKAAGFRVTQVMNLTDVDDKTIRGARQAGVPLRDFTQTFKDAFFADLRTLRIEPAEHYPAATGHIPEMVALIQTLLDKGFAYLGEDRSVYFSIARFPAYGQLARLDRDQMRPGVRIKTDEYAKEAMADFALWKAWDEADGDVKWDSPWGPGRPGWHIECSAMSMKYLGPSFDLHTGGIDNLFPHHEDEIAQSEAANGVQFVRYWLHCAHLMVEGEKMSKSLGNFYTLRDVLAKGWSGREVRWALLGTHYRQQLNFSFQGCADARAALRRLDEFKLRLAEARNLPGQDPGAVQARAGQAGREFRAGLEDDLNISAALAALFNFIRDANRLLDQGELAGPAAVAAATGALQAMDAVLGVLDLEKAGEAVPEAILALAQERQAARKAKDFARADALRNQLAAQGWLLEDTPQGPRVRKADTAG